MNLASALFLFRALSGWYLSASFLRPARNMAEHARLLSCERPTGRVLLGLKLHRACAHLYARLSSSSVAPRLTPRTCAHRQARCLCG